MLPISWDLLSWTLAFKIHIQLLLKVTEDKDGLFLLELERDESKPELTHFFLNLLSWKIGIILLIYLIGCTKYSHSALEILGLRVMLSITFNKIQ